MQKVNIRFADQGDPTTLVITVPGEISNSGQPLQSFALPLMGRNGGMLLALPSHAIADASLQKMMPGPKCPWVSGRNSLWQIFQIWF